MKNINKGGRPKTEPSSTRSLRLPVRLWNLIYKASKEYRSINEFFLYTLENDLIKRNLLNKNDRKSTKKAQNHWKKYRT